MRFATNHHHHPHPLRNTVVEHVLSYMSEFDLFSSCSSHSVLVCISVCRRVQGSGSHWILRSSWLIMRSVVPKTPLSTWCCSTHALNCLLVRNQYSRQNQTPSMGGRRWEYETIGSHQPLEGRRRWLSVYFHSKRWYMNTNHLSDWLINLTHFSMCSRPSVCQGNGLCPFLLFFSASS